MSLFATPIRSIAECEAEAHNILAEAIALYRPSKVFGMFSGGHDSLSACWIASQLVSEHVAFSGCVHINTGIGVEETREYVRNTCHGFGWPLLEYRSPITYESLVLKYGFPGPAGHGMMYTRLKERCIRQLIREHKTHLHDRIMLVGGMRYSESVRRMGNAEPHHREGCRVWCSPIVNWSMDERNIFIDARGLPKNPVVAKLCMSGECSCVDGNTLISTETGWRNIRDVVAGDRVWNFGTERKLELATVAVKHQNEPKPMLSIKPKYMRELLVTENHPLLVRDFRYQQKGRGVPAYIGAPKWVEAGEVATEWEEMLKQSTLCRTMTLLAVPFRRDVRPLGLTTEQLRLIGHFAAEGAYNWRKDEYRDGPGGIVFTLGGAAQDHAADITTCMEIGLGAKVHRRDWIDKRTGRAFITVRNCAQLSSEFISRFFYGRYCTEKSFTDTIMLASADEQEQILGAMWRGDGAAFRRTTRPVDVSTYCTSSIELALQVQEILLRQGRVYGIHATKAKRYSSGAAYQVRKETGDGSCPSIAFIENSVLWTPVGKITEGGIRETFNLTIDGEPNYRTGSCLVHNCGAFARPGERTEIEYHFPKLAAEIADLEAKAKAAGVHHVWGTRPPRCVKDNAQEPTLFSLCWSCGNKEAQL